MENTLHTWFLQQRSKRIPISILKGKAMEFYQKINKKDDFRAVILENVAQ